MGHDQPASPRPQTRNLPRRTRRYAQLLLVATLLIPLPLWADAFTAANETELVDAILVANANGVADTITLTDDVTVTARYSPGAGGANGLPTIFSDITVDGAGYILLRSSSDSFRFFQVNPAGTLTLADLTLDGGSTGTGGAIRNNGGFLALSNTTVRNSSASTGGGGVYSDGETYIEGGEVSGNLAFEGGGLFVQSGTTTLIDTAVTANEARTSLKNGGGIYVGGGSAVLIDTAVTYNFAGTDGGGICIGRDGTASLTNSTVAFNDAAAGGGGIRLRAGVVDGVRDGGSLSLLASTVSNNMAVDGGGLHVGPDCQAALTNSTISTNTAGVGGGLFVSQEGTATLAHSTVATNSATTPDSNGDFFDSIYIDTSGAPQIVFDGGRFKGGVAKTLPAHPVTLTGSLVSNFSTGPEHLNCNLPVADGGNSQVNYDAIALDSCGVLRELTGLAATLGANGGPTETHALECGSSAIDAAGISGLAADQRGIGREDDAHDSGSYEFQGGGAAGPLYPIALSTATVDPADPPVAPLLLPDIFNGSQPGNFGWLTWAGDPSVPVLAASLTQPGDSHTYVNPYDPADREVSVGDWIQGSPGVSNAREIRDLLDDLISSQAVITVPIWDLAENSGNNANYRVAGFAQVQLIDYHLPRDDMISAVFHGLVDPGCPAN